MRCAVIECGYRGLLNTQRESQTGRRCRSCVSGCGRGLAGIATLVSSIIHGGHYVVVSTATVKTGIIVAAACYQAAVYLGIRPASGITAVDIVAGQVSFTVIVPVKADLLITRRGSQTCWRCRSPVRCGRSLTGIAALVSSIIHGGHYIIVSNQFGNPAISVVAGCYQAAVYLGIGSTAGLTAVDIVAGQVSFSVVIPVETDLPDARSSCQTGRRCRSHVGGCGRGLAGIAALVSSIIHGGHYIVVSTATVKTGIIVAAACYQAAVYLGIRPASGITAVDIVAGQVSFTVIVPVKADLLIARGSDQTGWHRRRRVGWRGTGLAGIATFISC